MPFVTLDGAGDVHPLTLHYESWGDRPGAETVILVHELGGSLASLSEFGQRMANGYRVVLFDQRGAGLSEKPTRGWSLEDLGEDIKRLADVLSLREPFHLMGVAMGAVVALQFAVRHCHRLATLVLCDGTSEITDSAREYVVSRAKRVRADGMRPVLDQSFANAFRGLPRAVDDPAWATYRQRFVTNAPGSYAMHSEALAAMNLSGREIGRVVCPTLVLTGEHDFIWPPATGRTLASLLPNSKFAVVENAAHFPPIQEPQGTADRVLRFLETSKSPKAS